MLNLLRGLNQNLQYVDKRNNNLKEIPDEILLSKSLEELLLDSNHIRTLPKALYRLSKIRKLTLSENEILQLQPEIGNLTGLVEIDISKNVILDIPESIKCLKLLQVADFSSNPLKRVPLSIVYLQSLTDLKLNDVNLTELPSDFGRLVNLRVLELRDNILKQLPSSFVSLKNLECIDLANNMFEDMPPCLYQLINLKELWLDSNEISCISKDINKLKNMKCFDISENDLEFLPEEIGGMESLTDLYISQNWIQLLPNGIGNLQELMVLKADSNKLISLPLSLGKCSNLQELILKENEICSLPTSIRHLTKLKTLNVDSNKLNSLPPEICSLLQLTVLCLRDNYLYYLPEDIGVLKQLQVLDLCGNRIQHLPVSILFLNLKALWLSENQRKPLLRFQRDYDQKIQRDIITCYMLPQQEHQQFNMLQSGIPLKPLDKSISCHQRVEFNIESDDDLKDHVTPYPKDLQTKYVKLFPLKSKSEKSATMIPVEEKQVSNAWELYGAKTINHCMSPTTDSGVSCSASPVNLTNEKIYYEPSNCHKHTEVEATASSENLKSGGSSNHSLNEMVETSSENCLSLGKSGASFESEYMADYPDSNMNQELDCDIFDFIIIRESNGLGLSIAGGKESTPYKENDNGIFISKITENGASHKGGLHVDDKIIKINGVPLMDVDHYSAVQLLKMAGDKIKFTVLREQNVTKQIVNSSESLHISNFAKDPTGKLQNISQSSLSESKDTATNSNFKISYWPLNDSLSHTSKTRNSEASSGDHIIQSNAFSHVNNCALFEPDMTSTPMSFSRASVKSSPDPSGKTILNSLVDSVAYDIKDKYEGPLVKVTIENPRPYTPLTPDLPPKTKILGETSEYVTHSTFSETTISRMTKNSHKPKLPTERVILKRQNGSLGISIWGGIDQTCFPFGNGKPGIFISKKAINGSAADNEKIQIGDRILKVNNIDIRRASHAEAVKALCASVDEVELLLEHDVLPDGWQIINIIKPENDDIGITIGGGINGLRANPFDYYDEGIFITKIHKNSPAEKDGRLKVGMRLIEACNASLLGSNLEEAYNALNSTSNSASFIVCNGFNQGFHCNNLFSFNPRSDSTTESIPFVNSDSESIDAFHPFNQNAMLSDEKSVDEKVLDVVHAAEQLVLPEPRIFVDPLGTMKKKKTTTIVLSKHTIHSPSNDQEQMCSKQSYLPCEV